MNFIIDFFRDVRRHIAWSKAKKQVEKLNKSSKYYHILISYDGNPLILTKKDFKKFRAQGVFKSWVCWEDLVKRQIM